MRAATSFWKRRSAQKPPVFAYGPGASGTGGVQWAAANLWPHTPLPITTPHLMSYDQITPRNCMPSLHTAWATAIFIHTRKGPRILRCAGTFWLIATLAATLGFGYHYGVALIAGVVFALTIEAALRSLDRGWVGRGSSWSSTALRSSLRYWCRTAVFRWRWPDTRRCPDHFSSWR